MAIKEHIIKTDADILDIANKFGSTSTFRRILRTARRIAGGCCIIEQEDNVCCEIYKDEFEGAYKRQFAEVPETCTRLRFLKQKRGKKQKCDYIGFCTIRPRKPASITHAMFPPPYGRERDSYCLCSARFENTSQNVANSCAVTGYPYMQQDGIYDRCAHIALLGINWYLAEQKLAKKMSISEIVNTVREIPFPGRDFPSEGLGLIQITHVLKKMGMVPLVYAYPSEKGELQFPPQRIIYHYVESGFPVLIGIPIGNTGHALVVIGHTFSPDNWWPIASESYYKYPPSGGLYHCSTTWIDNFIISDDNLGPYLTIDKNFFEAKAQQNLVIVVALPEGIILKGEDAEVYAYNILSEELQMETLRLSPNGKSHFWSEHFWNHYRRKNDPVIRASDIVLRTFLRKGKDLIEEYENDDYPNDFKRLIKETPLPPYVWVTELSTPGLFAQDRKNLGKIVLDPTGDPRLSENLLLIRHLPGLLHCRNAKTEVTSRFVFEGDHPRSHLAR
jgi:hypothetical protein